MFSSQLNLKVFSKKMRRTLHKCNFNALQTPSILHKFHLLSFCSTSSSLNSSFADYLEQTLGFSKQQSLSTSTKLTRFRQQRNTQYVNTINFAENANAVINFLKKHDFDDTHVRKIVSFRPAILLSNVDKTLVHIQELGICGPHLADFVFACPAVLRCNLGPLLKPLRSMLGSDDNVVRFLKSLKVRCLTESAANYLVYNVNVLEREYGIRSDVIRIFILKRPRSFAIKNDKFRDVLIRVEKELGIPRNSPMFFSGVQVLSGFRREGLELKFGVFKEYGWSVFEIVKLFGKIPHCLALSDCTLRKKLDFLMKELGYDAAYLASHPCFLTFSLEKRVFPRRGVLLVLKEKGLSGCLSFVSVLSMSETKFLEIFVLPYKDVIPGLYESYLDSRGAAADGSVKKRMFKSRAAE